jgi:hypothetical protein
VIAMLVAGSTTVLVASLRLWRLARDAGPRHFSAGVVALALAACAGVLGAWPEPLARLTAELAGELVGRLT